MIRPMRGFSLVEMLVAMAILVVVVSLVCWVVCSAGDSSRRVQADVQAVLTRVSLLESLAADVRCSARILTESDGLRTGPVVLVLQRPDTGPVVYRFKDGRALRRTGLGKDVREVPVGRLRQLAFAYDGDDVSRSGWVDVAVPGSQGGRVVTHRFYLMNTEAP